MALTVGLLKLAAGGGVIAVCGGSAVAVAADTRPGAAPLRPPVAASAGVGPNGDGAGTPSTTPSLPAGDQPPLVIPDTPCTPPGRPNRGTPSSRPTLDPSLSAAYQQYRQAMTKAAKQQVLASLSADQRQQLTAYLASLAAASGRSGTGGSGGSCSATTGTSTSPTVTIVPSVTGEGTVKQATVSAVS